MNKLIKGYLITFYFVLLLTSNSFAEEPQEISITIDGIKQNFTTPPMMMDGIVFLPIRDLFESLGLELEWSQELKEVTGMKGDCKIIAKIDSTTALVDNKLKIMPRCAFLHEGKTMIPVRFIGESLDMRVDWDPVKKQINMINSELEEQLTESSTSITYEYCISQGIKKSIDYQNAIIHSEKAKESNEDLYLALGSYNLKMIQEKQDLALQDKWAEMQIAITSERVGINIRNLMDEISLIKEEEKLVIDKMEFLEYKIEMEKLKYENGLISLNQLNDLKTEYGIELQAFKELSKKIEILYIQLNSALEIPQGIQKDLEYRMAYEPIGLIDLKIKIIDSIVEDPYIWYCKENLNTKTFKLVTYEYNLPEGKSYSLTEIDVSEARKNLLHTEKELDRVIRERYQTLLDLEDRIKTIKLSYTQAKRTVNIIRLQYDLGMSTKAQIEEAQLAVSKNELEIHKLKQQHEQIKILFLKPYLAPEYFVQNN